MMPSASPPVETPPAPRVAVRTLCDFAARHGDLDLRHTPGPTAAQGVAGHALVTGRRGPGYAREVTLHGVCEGLWLHGRADGVDTAARRVEEIKTHRGDPARLSDHARQRHWAQARVYGWLLAAQHGWDAVVVALVYLNIDTGTETVLEETRPAAELAETAAALCRRYRDWAAQETAHRAARDAALRTLAFPFPAFRDGQRALAEAVFRTQRAGRHLLAQAPTGIGKTAATLFAALRALPEAGGDQLLYLTARTTGRAPALAALRRLDARPLRVVERVARDKACEHPDAACHGESCPLARGFYDRLHEARAAAAQRGWLDADSLRAIAREHRVCPYFLGQEMHAWADVVVADVNHYFDAHAQAWALAQAREWRLHLLIDEAHNLVERARRMHSATLEPARFLALRRTAPAGLRRGMDRLHRAWGALARDLRAPWQPLDAPPPALLQALRAHVGELSDALGGAAGDTVGHTADQAAGPASPGSAATAAWQDWLFEALAFLRVADDFGPHAAADLEARPGRGGRPAIALRNLLPAPLLAPRWTGAHSATLFSATLAPMDHAATLLGLPPDAARTDIGSPFSADQLRVRIAPLSTRWADRARTRDALVDLIATELRRSPGNYLAFFSSFDYLQQVADALQRANPDIPLWQQSRHDDEAARAAFLARFTPDGHGVGFAVLGGAFGEGIDLPGRRLVGAFVATLGLPAVNPINERLRERLHALCGHGFEHTYLYPGLHKAVQAAGRVIRTPEDRGTVWLIDDRYARPAVRALLPAWWRVEGPGQHLADEPPATPPVKPPNPGG